VNEIQLQGRPCSPTGSCGEGLNDSGQLAFRATPEDAIAPDGLPGAMSAELRTGEATMLIACADALFG
jgi:hypothetical protein